MCKFAKSFGSTAVAPRAETIVASRSGPRVGRALQLTAGWLRDFRRRVVES